MCPPGLLERKLSGKTYVVTGGNSGIGRATSEQLVTQGAHVVIGCRRPEEGERLKSEWSAKKLPGSLDVIALDLADLQSVRSFATELQSRQSELNGLINNAGVMHTPFSRTKEGFEMQFGTNHLGHFLLTELLLPLLKKSAPSRIVILSSCYHDKAQGREGKIHFDDVNFEKRKYDGWEAYAQSKLANLLHAKELAKRLKGTGVTAVSVHPGWVRTPLFRNIGPLWLQDYLLRPLLRLAGMIEPWEGAQTTLYALLAPEVDSQSGAFFSQTGF